MHLEFTELSRYLTDQYGSEVTITHMRQLSGNIEGTEALKQFGYGCPIHISYLVNGDQKDIVIHLINRNAFGHERDDDRVAAVWYDYNTFGRLPGHVPAVDMIACMEDGTLSSIRDARELLLATAYRPGRPYANDFFRIRDEGQLQTLDIQRAETLATYLGQIHRVKRDDPILWRRRLRDLIGHGEGIMGLTDSYPLDLPYTNERDLRRIEETANRWRWHLKPLSHRLSQVHGDFHPFNILFDGACDFHILDRSRGEWGEPADDVSCLTINYIFFSLQRYGRLAGPFQELHERFWTQYLATKPDHELTTVIQPWFAWRILVVASPIWYPTITEAVRRKLFTFAHRVLATDRYDYADINQYF